MDNIQSEILQNFRGLFNKYAPVVINKGKQVSITVDGVETIINQSQRNLSQKTTRLS